MRIRKKKWVLDELKSCGFYLSDPSKFVGVWNDHFANNNPIHIELGCGKGQFISDLSVLNKDINYIAIDIKDEMLGLTKRNIEKKYSIFNQEINNIKIFSCDIQRIDLVMNSFDRVDRIYINFCNPWPKIKHKKRRLTHPRQLLKYKHFLNKDGEIWFKTDDYPLFIDTLKYLSDENFKIKYITQDLHKSEFNDNILTEHEEMFSKNGIDIKFLISKLN